CLVRKILRPSFNESHHTGVNAGRRLETGSFSGAGHRLLGQSSWEREKGGVQATRANLACLSRPSATAARTCKTQWAPAGDQRICRFLFILAFTRLPKAARLALTAV